MTTTAMKGTLSSLFRSRKSITIKAMVINKVMTLKVWNVSMRIFSGLVKALELAAIKNASRFSIDNGKN